VARHSGQVLTACGICLRAKACAIILPETTNFTAAWGKEFCSSLPYREDFDFVAPLYSRHKNDGFAGRETLLYPMSRASLWSKDPRTQFRRAWLLWPARWPLPQTWMLWREESVRTSPEAWMAVTAISFRLSLLPILLGPPKCTPSRAQEPGPSFTAVRQTVGDSILVSGIPTIVLDGTHGIRVRADVWDQSHELTSEPVRVNRKRIFRPVSERCWWEAVGRLEVDTRPGDSRRAATDWQTDD